MAEENNKNINKLNVNGSPTGTTIHFQSPGKSCTSRLDDVETPITSNSGNTGGEYSI